MQLRRMWLLPFLLLGLQSAFGAELFFTNAPAEGPFGVFHVDLGSNEVESIVSDLPSVSRIDTDVGGNRLYWTAPRAGVFSSALDGTDVRTIRSGTALYVGLFFDEVNQHVYWSEQNLIFRANPDGSDATFIAATSATAIAQDLTIDYVGNKLYASDWNGLGAPGAVRRMNLDGSGYETFVPNVSWGPGGLAIEPAAGRLYYGRVGPETEFGAIYSVPLTGGANRVEVENIRPRDIELDLLDRRVYWNERGTTDNPGIRRAMLDGGTGIENLPLGDITPAGIAFVPEPASAFMLVLVMVALRRAR